MYFFKKRKKIFLDLRGDLILSHNPALVTARLPSAAPHFVRNGRYILDLKGKYGFWHKIRATFATIGFIWGKSERLHPETIIEDYDNE